jgi:hypothetical protein
VNDIGSIITNLEWERDAIERALSALREIQGPGSGSAAVPTKRRGRPPGSKSRRSPEARKRMSEGQLRRWAGKKSGEEVQPEPAQRKRRPMTALEKKRLSKLMKARWASKNPPKPRAKK